MRLLGISDIHGDLAGVITLRKKVKSVFDAIVVAGDIASGELNSAQEIMSVLSTFGCPVLYVLGNWDWNVPYDVDLGRNCVHLHHRSFELCGVRFVGMSGVVQNWGLHPIALEVRQRAVNVSQARHLQDVKTRRLKRSPPWGGLYIFETERVNKEIYSRNREALIKTISEGNPLRTIVITHDRVFRMQEEIPNVPLYLFGHKHEYSDTVWRGSRYLNISCLDTNYLDGGWYHDINIDNEMKIDYESISIIDEKS
jgi:predicted phosphodiesterase